MFRLAHPLGHRMSAVVVHTVYALHKTSVEGEHFTELTRLEVNWSDFGAGTGVPINITHKLTESSPLYALTSQLGGLRADRGTIQVTACAVDIASRSEVHSQYVYVLAEDLAVDEHFKDVLEYAPAQDIFLQRVNRRQCRLPGARINFANWNELKQPSQRQTAPPAAGAGSAGGAVRPGQPRVAGTENEARAVHTGVALLQRRPERRMSDSI
eukprot:1232277-Prymnesium_polylepis.1